ncbi:response regulator [Cohnella sp. GCM10027633]|uniref:response regulator n=1 Tax=unclassified Cohnella TaxID=2636738 RepID=UPI00362A775D
MIRTLLVDDEPIVRKGLLHILPWDKHGMSVVADVGSGDKALEWLASEKIDLVVTDLTMPGMSGFELIERMQERHPAVSVAILTCHQEFDYVQEAIRMGALDYIVKTEMDDEKLDKLFGRISTVVRGKLAAEGGAVKQSARGKDGILFVGLASDCSVNELYAAPWIADRMPYPVSNANQAWFVEADPEQEQPSRLDGLLASDRWAIVVLHHLTMKDRLRELLSQYLRRHLYYVANPREGSVWHDSLRDVMAFEEKRGQADWTVEWEALDWVFDDSAWHELQGKIVRQRPLPAELCEKAYKLARAWQGIRKFAEAKPLVREACSLGCWQEWKHWLERVRLGMRAAVVDEAEAGHENPLRILRSIQLVLARLQDGVTQEEVAASVNISRGYFSDSFKRIVGTTFNEFMRELRVDNAKLWLVRTELPIGEISQRCGFADLPYFRKLFRDETGMTPREYSRLPSAISEFELGYIGKNAK